MGRLRSQVNHTGAVINDITLGQPVGPVHGNGSTAQPGDAITDLYWVWDDARLPNGIIDADGEVIVDEDNNAA